MKSNTRYDAIVIGGGVNGLTCAALLGKAGLRTLLLERRDAVGAAPPSTSSRLGSACPTLAHRTGPLRATSSRSCSSPQHGLSFVAQPIRYTALAPDGRALPVSADADRTADAIRPWSGTRCHCLAGIRALAVAGRGRRRHALRPDAAGPRRSRAARTSGR